MQVCSNYTIIGLQCRCAQIIQSQVYSVALFNIYIKRLTVQVCSSYAVTGLQCTVALLKLCNHRVTVQFSSINIRLGLQCSCAQTTYTQVYSVVVLKQHTLRLTVYSMLSFTLQLSSNNIDTGLQCSCDQTTYTYHIGLQCSCVHTTYTQVYSVVFFKIYSHRLTVQFSSRYIHTG